MMVPRGVRWTGGIGLTGGIASGKSTVSRFFREEGAEIIDADEISRRIVSPETPLYREVVNHFGERILCPDGRIDRGKLGEIVFFHPEERKALESMIHPWVFAEMTRAFHRIKALRPDALIIFDVPLLFETGMDHEMAIVVVVYVPAAVQRERLMKRDGLDATGAMARIRSQFSIEKKKKRADILIDNTGSLDHTRNQTRDVYITLRSMTRDQDEKGPP